MNSTQETISETELEKAYAHCAKEPIHIPDSIQPHGFLKVLNENLVIEKISDNAHQFLSRTTEESLGNTVNDVLDEAAADGIAQLAEQCGKQHTSQSSVFTIRKERYDTVVHKIENKIVVECEPVLQEAESVSLQTMYRQLDYFTHRLQRTGTIDEQCQIAAEEIHKLTGFARTKIYQFDEDWHGHVIAESKDEHMKSYLGHHFPAGDIPEQARKLYIKNPLRIIPNVNYKPVRLSTTHDTDPLDMSLSILRSVSPVHLQYLRHMNIAASMSVSILRGDRLWGLICCHHETPKYTPYPVRMIAQLIGKILALQISVLTTSQELEYKEKIQRRVSILTSKLRNQTNAQSIEGALPDVTDTIGASGIVLKLGHQTFVSGNTPTKNDIGRLIGWLKERHAQQVFSTHSLSSHIEVSDRTKTAASGVLAVPIGKSTDDVMLWFRPEVIETIKWAGNPDQAKNLDATGKFLNPRQSFDLWEQTVKNTALPWKKVDLEAAQQLADTVYACQLDRKLKDSYKEIETFIYITSHDFRSPLVNLRGFSEELKRSLDKLSETHCSKKEDIQSIVEKDAATALRFINNAVDKLDVMTNAMLELSRTGKRELAFKPINTETLVNESIQTLQHQITEKGITVNVRQLPSVMADYVSLQQIFGNILDNAVKYLDPSRAGVIEVLPKQTDTETIFTIKDNGRGIDKKNIHKVFEIFQRIGVDVPGEGMGMAYVKKLVERHGGKLWCESEKGKGTSFFFSIAKNLPEQETTSLETT